MHLELVEQFQCSAFVNICKRLEFDTLLFCRSGVGLKHFFLLMPHFLFHGQLKDN